MSKSVSMDARKFVKFINESVQSQTAIMCRYIQNIGKKVGKNYDLIALHRNNLVFEDIDLKQYYVANYTCGKNRHITMSDVNQINIQESKKEHVFKNACAELVNSICEDQNKNAEIAFKKLEGCRFRSTVANDDGFIITKDGRRRKIYEFKQNANTKSIVEHIQQVLGDNIIMENNQIVSADSSGEKIMIPITEENQYHLTATRMKHTAKNAYKSPTFGKLVRNVSSLVSNDDIHAAIVESVKFLKEYQEFCMLTLTEMKELVGNTLATHNIYSHTLVEDVSLLMYKSNLKVNKSDIIESWSNVAKLGGKNMLLENVNVLASADDFYGQYEVFLHKMLVEDKADYKNVLRGFFQLILQRMDDYIERHSQKKDIEQDIVDSAGKAIQEDVETLSPEIEKMKENRDKIEQYLDQLDDPNLSGEAEITLGEYAKELGPAIEQTLQQDGQTEDEEIVDVDQMPNIPGDVEDDVEAGEEGDLGGMGGMGGMDMPGGDLDDISDEGLEGLEGLEEGGEGGEEDEGLDDLDDLQLDDINRMNITMLQETFNKISSDKNQLLEHKTLIPHYIQRCETMGDTLLAESFSILVESDQYEDFTISEKIKEINKNYGAKTVTEAQRKSPTTAKKRSRPAKKSLMKESEGVGTGSVSVGTEETEMDVPDETITDIPEEIETDIPEETVTEAQRKSPTTAKKRSRPDMTKKSLMKESEEIDEATEISVTTSDPEMMDKLSEIMDDFNDESFTDDEDVIVDTDEFTEDEDLIVDTEFTGDEEITDDEEFTDEEITGDEEFTDKEITDDEEIDMAELEEDINRGIKNAISESTKGTKEKTKPTFGQGPFKS